jgi:hypothetical protein
LISFLIDNYKESLVISFKKNVYKKSALIFGLFIALTILFAINYSQPVFVNAEFISSSSDMETFVVSELENGKTYEFKVVSDSMFDDYDIGFAIYTHSSFKDKYIVLTQDDPGEGDEVANYTATSDDDIYLGVWMNDGDYGFVEITITETVSLDDISYEDFYQSIWYSLQWLWIMLGVITGVTIFFVVIIVVVFVRAAQKHAGKVKDALAKGIALPRHGRKKNKCPFCGVKLPPESLVTCPYCNAPITDE